MSANRIVFWLDDQGEAWVRDYEPCLESLSSQFIRLKGEHPKATDQELDHWLVLEDRWGDGASLASLHLQEVLRLWSKVPPASDTDDAVFFETDVWTDFEVHGQLGAESGGFESYAERLGTLLPQAGAVPAKALQEPYGAFRCAGEWIQKVRNSLFDAWQAAHARDDFRSVVSDSDLKSRGLDMLDVACIRGYERLALALIKRGVPADRATLWDYPFARACGEGRLEFIQSLLRAGANPNPPDGGRHSQVPLDTPLSAAACAGHIEVVRFLLEHGARPSIGGGTLLDDVRNAQRNTRFGLEPGTSYIDPYPTIIDLLVKAGAKE